MAGKGFESSGDSPLDDIWDAIDKLHRTLTNTRNNRQPTVPIYPAVHDPNLVNDGTWPDDPVEGQHTHARDGSSWQYTDGVWQPVGPTKWFNAVLEAPWSTPSGERPLQYARGKHLLFRGTITGGSSGLIFYIDNAIYWPDYDEHYIWANGPTPIVVEVSSSDGGVTLL